MIIPTRSPVWINKQPLFITFGAPNRATLLSSTRDLCCRRYFDDASFCLNQVLLVLLVEEFQLVGRRRMSVRAQGSSISSKGLVPPLWLSSVSDP